MTLELSAEIFENWKFSGGFITCQMLSGCKPPGISPCIHPLTQLHQLGLYFIELIGAKAALARTFIFFFCFFNFWFRQFPNQSYSL